MKAERSNTAESDSKLPRSLILRGKESFNGLFQSGQSVHAPSVSVRFILTDATSNPSRMGFVVSKKLGNAVLRNKLKRRLREAYRQHKHLFLQSGFSFEAVLMARKSDADYQTLVTDVMLLAQKFQRKAASSLPNNAQT